MLVLALAQLLSIAGDRVHYLALVSLLTKSDAPAASLVWLGQAMLVPALLFSPFIGPLVDRWRLVAVLVVADAARALVVALMPQAWTAAGVPALLGLVFLGFTLNCFFLPARSALPPRLVPPGAALLSVNAFLTLCGVAATVLGSGFGGKIVDAIGWRGALYLDAATFGVSAILLVFLWPVTSERKARRRLRARRYFQSVIAGLIFLLRSAAARRAMLASIGLWVGGGFLFVAGALHAQDAPGRVGSLGLLIALFGGGLAASAAWAMSRRALSPRWALGGGLLGAGIGLGLFAATHSFWIMATAATWTGLCVGPLLASAETELQQAAGERKRGRVFAGRDFASRLGFLLAIAAAGGVVHSAGATAALAVGSGALAVMGVAAMRLRPSAP